MILSFLTAAAVFAGVFAAELAFVWLNCEKLHHEISMNSYPYRMAEQMKADIGELLDKHAVRREALADIWDEQELYRIFYTYSENVLLKGKTEQNDTYGFEEKIKQSIEETLKVQEAENLEAVSEEIDLTAAEAAVIYQNCMYPGFLERFYQLSEGAKPILYAVMAISLFVMTAAAFVLWKLSQSKRHAMEYIAGGFLAGSIWNLPAVLLMGNGRWVTVSGIGPEFYRNFVEAFLNRGLQAGLMVTGIEIFVFLIMCTRIRREKKT